MDGHGSKSGKGRGRAGGTAPRQIPTSFLSGRSGGGDGGGGGRGCEDRGRGGGGGGAPHVSEREEGVVKALRDTFGFITVLSEPKYGDIYFALEGVQPPVQVGARVTFAVDLNRRNGEYRASGVSALAAPPPSLLAGFDGAPLSLKPGGGFGSFGKLQPAGGSLGVGGLWGGGASGGGAMGRVPGRSSTGTPPRPGSLGPRTASDWGGMAPHLMGRTGSGAPILVRSQSAGPPISPTKSQTSRQEQLSEEDEILASLGDGDEPLSRAIQLPETGPVFANHRAAAAWLVKRVVEAEAPRGEDGLLLRLAAAGAPLDDILGRHQLPPDACSNLLRLLASPAVRRSVQREKADTLYRRVLGSAFCQPLCGEQACDSALASYLLQLPHQEGLDPTVRVARFADVRDVLRELQARGGSDARRKDALPWSQLAQALRAASLPWTLEEELSNMVHAGGLEGGPAEQSAVGPAPSSSACHQEEEEETDFRRMSLVPSAFELLRAPPPTGLRANRLGPGSSFDSPLQYLDTHFRLLREDCTAPLRTGVRAYLAGEQTGDVRVYPGCRLVGLKCGREGVVYRTTFRLPPGCSVSSWERSKRLMFGSLLLLSCDGFRTLLWATVAGRDAAMCDPRGGVVDLRFAEAGGEAGAEGGGYESRFLPGVAYTLVESAATYFEAYRHVLAALQAAGAQPDQLPFADQLLRPRGLQPGANPAVPGYLRGGSGAQAGRYLVPALFPRLAEETRREGLHVLGDWPAEDTASSPLDASQLAAARHALTREVALVQGPPGTGKTFVGLKIVDTLLLNARSRAPKPILVVTMSFPARDQFLEGCLELLGGEAAGVAGELIRVGGRSKSPSLQACNLRERAYEAGRRDAEKGRDRRALTDAMRKLEKCIEELVAEAASQELTEEELEKVAHPPALEALRRGGPGNSAFLPLEAKLKLWLQPAAERAAQRAAAAESARTAREKGGKGKGGGGKGGGGGAAARERAQRRDRDASTLDDDEEEEGLEVDGDGRVVMGGAYDEDDRSGAATACLSFSRLALDDMCDDDFEADDAAALEAARAEEEAEEDAAASSPCRQMDDAQLLALTDVWALPPRARARLHAAWRRAVHAQGMGAELADACARYERLARERRQLEEESLLVALRQARVVGLTTSGLAAKRRLIAALECEVVVVEEAAEVLEAHLLSALSPATRHLILIGDHLQLRPSTAVYDLARRFGLDVSLFERLIGAGAEHVQLTRQRRMRPCISALLAPVYPALRDHPDTATFPPVPGMAVPLYFLSHAQPESHDGESNSRSNEHEAALSQALTQHLLRSGVAPSRITVLTTYCGQLVRLRKRFRAPGGEVGLDEVRLCSVDQFQGEESDIIILSLVRSNTLGSIGFLSVQNRMVVALSRARHGLYILGNGTLLSGRSALWRGVLEQLGATRAIGPALLVEAGGKRFEVAQPADFSLCQLAGYPAK